MPMRQRQEVQKLPHGKELGAFGPRTELRAMGWALNVGYASALTAASPWLAWRALRTGRYREGWPERLLGCVPTLPANRSSIWVHGVSLGEIQLLRTLVEKFHAEQSQHQ